MAAKKKSAAKAKPKNEGAFPTEVTDRVPRSLADALPALADKFGGLFVHGIPYRDPNEKRSLVFDPHAAHDILSTYGESLPQTASFVPLAYVGRRPDDEAFAVDPSKPELPVYFFEHEAGYHAFAPSLDAFTSSLLAKGEKTPLEKLAKLVEKAVKLDEKKKYAEVVALLEPGLEGIPRVRTPMVDTLPRAVNLLGLGYRYTGKTDRAIAMFEEAARLGEDNGYLNLCELYEEVLGDHARTIEVAKPLVARGYRLGSYAWFWARNYLGRAYVVVGDLPRATRAFHEIHVEHAVDKPANVAKAIEGLETLATEKGGEVAVRAKAILAWLAAPPQPFPAAEIAAARAWWTGLQPKVRAKVAGSAKVEGEPADEALGRVLRLESIDVSNAGVEDLSFLKPLRHVTSIDVEGNPLVDFSTLPDMPRLERLRASECKKLVSTRGLERAPNLTHLTARECTIADLEGLASLTAMVDLDLAKNELKDIAALSKMSELEDVTLYNNKITDLTPLGGCTRLKKISCFGNDKIAKGLLALVGLRRLEEIGAISWEISEKEMDAFQEARPDVDLDAEGRSKPLRRDTNDADRAWWASLDAHPALRAALRADLDDETPIDEQLGKLVDEDHISIEDSGVTSIAPLAQLKQLDFLAVSGNPLESFAGLENHERLERVRARGTRVRDLRPLAGRSSLFELDVTETPITSLEGLEGCPGLRKLKFADTAVKSLAPLAATAELREIAFSGAPVDDLGPLAKHCHLRLVDCSATEVRDLSPLAACTALQRIDCYGLAGVTGLTALAALPRLRVVHGRGCLDPAEIAELQKARPDVLVD